MGDKAAAGKAIGVGSLIALATGILATRDKAQAAPPNGGAPTKDVSLDEAAMALLLAIARSGENTTELLSTLNQIVSGVPPGELPSMENLPEIAAFTVVPTAANAAIRLPGRAIPPGMDLVIKAMHTNAGIIYVANSRTEATNPHSAYTLIANEAVEYKVSTPHHIWISGTVVGEGVVCTVEQAAGGR